MRDVTLLAGRLLLSAIFLWSGWGKITGWDATAAYMASAGMPAAGVFLAGAILLELAGGLSVATGYKVRIGAVALIVFLIPATFIFHTFWDMPAEQQRIQQVMFLKNLSILGGLLLLFGSGGGRFSLGYVPPKDPFDHEGEVSSFHVRQAARR